MNKVSYYAKQVILNSFLLFFLCTSTPLQAQSLTKIWEVNTLEAPESVVFHAASKLYYVSNVAGQPAEKNAKGYISKIDEKGQVVEQKWIIGLNAPKGLGIWKNQLYIADIDVVVVVDLEKGTIVKRYAAEGATFLNDVEIGPDGSVYISDTFGGNGIYRIKDNSISLWLKSEELDYPNGLKIKGKELFVGAWGVVTNPETFETENPGGLLAVDLMTKAIRKVSSNTGNLDGVVVYKNDFLATDWIAGKLYKITSKGAVSLLHESSKGAADLIYLPKQKTIIIPQMLDGKLIAYTIK